MEDVAINDSIHDDNSIKNIMKATEELVSVTNRKNDVEFQLNLNSSLHREIESFKEQREKIPLKILILDFEDEAKQLVSFLEDNGYSVNFTSVEDIQTFKELINDFSLDLIISEYSMPNLCVFDALAYCKENNIKLPFIVISDQINERAIIKTMQEGATDCVSKSNHFRLVPIIERERNITRFCRQHSTDIIQFQQMLDSTDYAQCLIDMNFKIIHANRAFALMFEVPSDQIQGKSCYQILPYFLSIPEYPLTRILNGNDSVTYNTEGTLKNGIKINVSVKAAACKGNNGKVNGIFAMIRDISKQDKLYLKDKPYLQDKLYLSNKRNAVEILTQIKNPVTLTKFNAHLIKSLWYDISPILDKHFNQYGDYSIGNMPYLKAIELIPKLISNIHEHAVLINNLVENVSNVDNKP